MGSTTSNTDCTRNGKKRVFDRRADRGKNWSFKMSERGGNVQKKKRRGPNWRENSEERTFARKAHVQKGHFVSCFKKTHLQTEASGQAMNAPPIGEKTSKREKKKCPRGKEEATLLTADNHALEGGSLTP